MKKLTIIGLIFIFVLSNVGCWSRKETETLAIVSAIAIDRVDIGGKKMYRLTENIVLPRQLGVGLGKGGSGGETQPRLSWVVSSLGESIEEAGRNLSTRVPRTMFLAHSRIIIFGETISREGLAEALDFLTRYKEVRERSLVLITRGEAAKALLVEPEMEREISHETAGIEDFGSTQSPKVGKINLKDFSERVITPGIDAWEPIFEVLVPPEKPKPKGSPEQTVSIKGIAMFKTNQLVGWLEEPASQAVMLITNQAKHGDISVNIEGSTVTCLFRNPHAKTTAKISGKSINVTIQLKLDMEVVESSPFPLTTQEGIKKVEEGINRELEAQIRTVLKKSQTAGSDILGIGREVEKTKHLYWHQIQDRWGQIYPQVSFQVKVESKLSRTGMRNKAFDGKLLSR